MPEWLNGLVCRTSGPKGLRRFESYSVHYYKEYKMNYFRFREDSIVFQNVLDYVEDKLQYHNILSHGWTMSDIDLDDDLKETGVQVTFENYRCGDTDWWEYFVPSDYFFWYEEGNYGRIDAAILARDKAEKKAKEDAIEKARLDKIETDKQHAIRMEELEHENYIRLRNKYGGTKI